MCGARTGRVHRDGPRSDTGNVCNGELGSLHPFPPCYQPRRHQACVPPFLLYASTYNAEEDTLSYVGDANRAKMPYAAPAACHQQY